jgi:conjugal transfer pilus assembly protein TraU
MLTTLLTTINSFYRVSAFVLLLSLSQLANAKNLCHGKFVNPISDVCWFCLFPITIGNAAVIKGSQPDTSKEASYNQTLR